VVFGRTSGLIRDYADPKGQLGGMAASVAAGSTFKWLCVGCRLMKPLDLAEWLDRCGPRYSMLNQIDVCPECGAPRFLMWSRGRSTPYLPMKVEWLMMLREVATDPEAWFEIHFMEGPGTGLDHER